MGRQADREGGRADEPGWGGYFSGKDRTPGANAGGSSDMACGGGPNNLLQIFLPPAAAPPSPSTAPRGAAPAARPHPNPPQPVPHRHARSSNCQAHGCRLRCGHVPNGCRPQVRSGTELGLEVCEEGWEELKENPHLLNPRPTTTALTLPLPFAQIMMRRNDTSFRWHR